MSVKFFADSNCARSLVLWFEHCGMTELYHMRGTLEAGLIGLPYQKAETVLSSVSYIYIYIYIERERELVGYAW